MWEGIIEVGSVRDNGLGVAGVVAGFVGAYGGTPSWRAGWFPPAHQRREQKAYGCTPLRIGPVCANGWEGSEGSVGISPCSVAAYGCTPLRNTMASYLREIQEWRASN